MATFFFRAMMLLLLGWRPAHAQKPVGSQAASFSFDQRARHYVHRTYSWQRMITLGVDSGFDHLLEDPREWGQGPEAFGYRYAAGFAKRVVRNSIELGLGAALREDTRFQPSQRNGLRNRIRYATLHAFTAVHPDGEVGPAYSRFGAMICGALIGYSWYPRPLTAPDFFQGIAFGTIGHLQNSFLTEFAPDMKNFGKRIRRKVTGFRTSHPAGTPPDSGSSGAAH
jgi:hypothetical protein